MELVLDIGNSAVKGGLFVEGRLERTFRLERGASLPDADWEAALRGALRGAEVQAVGIASVVPAWSGPARALAEAATRAPSRLLDARVRLPFRMSYETPQTLGIDRLAAAAAAHGLFQETPSQGVIAVDAGTALTFEVVDASGVYRGGLIAPGPALMRASLHEGTAQLPDVPLERPPTYIGRSTQEAMQVGLMHGFTEAVGGLLRRVTKELGTQPNVVATGGWGSVLGEAVEEISYVEPHLVLRGIRELLMLNPPEANVAVRAKRPP